MQGANGPVQAVLVENWVVYTYWSRTAHRFQATVVELYDDSPHDLTAAQLVFGSHNSTMSSYRPVELEVSTHRMLPSIMASAPMLIAVVHISNRHELLEPELRAWVKLSLC